MKRSNGEGSYGKKTIKGQQYFTYRFPDEKRTQVYAKTQKELKEKIKKKQEELEKRKLPDSSDAKTTFGEYMLMWLNTKEKSVESTTFDCYEDIINSMVVNYKGYNISNVQMHNITDKVFQKYLNSLADNYAHSSIVKMWRVIKMCVKYAEVQGDINPHTTTLVNVPKESECKHKTKEVPFLSEEDLEKLYQVSNAENSKKGYIFGNNAKTLMLIAYTGCRSSEIIALKWKNYNKKEKSIYIEESAANIRNRKRKEDDTKYKSIDKGTKSDKGRIVPLPDRAIEMIEWFDLFNPSHSPDDYICLSDSKTKVNQRNLRRTLHAMAKKADCDQQDFSPHTLRHTYGSILLRNGVDIKMVSELLGHSDISITYNIYIGILEKDKSKFVQDVFN